ncbi:hypothetical protein [Streptomyces vilmorinianum]|uniref:hypothetical protein n=1 Tax=Streptomyces vilmorinianum TaxID=3051092 RepID=UPI0010FAD932|nr:hypothetical protein [Streptomyces vilmorinianum]
MAWQREGYTAHEGEVGVLLADGSEPGPVYFDTGSSGSFHESTDWWVYDGTFGAPLAARMRARCSCGWRADISYPLDWDQVQRREPHDYDTSAPAGDWEAHLDDVEARTVPLPAEVSDLLHRLRQRLEGLVDDAPLAALKAVNELESIAASVGPSAAFLAVHGDRIPWRRIAEGLGTTEPDARSRLHRYEYRR